MQALTDATILAVIDELRSCLPGFDGVSIIHPWAISAISAASAGVVAGHRTHHSVVEAARATAMATFHVKPLSYGNRVLAAVLAQVVFATNGEERNFHETVHLVGAEI